MIELEAFRLARGQQRDALVETCELRLPRGRDERFRRDHGDEALGAGERGRAPVGLREQVLLPDAHDRRRLGTRPVGERRPDAGRDLLEQR